MNEGMLWWYGEVKVEALAAKIREAATHYQKKYGRAANVALVNDGMLDTQIQVDGITVLPSPIVLLGHVWIGLEERMVEVQG